MHRVDADLIVVGGGPAGCAAAITARRAGLGVVLLDRARFPRDKTCGDGLTANALRLLFGLGLDVREIEGDGGFTGIDEVVVVSPSGRRIDLPMPSRRGHCAVVTRRRLDAALLDVARSAGTDVREGCEVVATSENEGIVRLGSQDGTEVCAPFVVAADGHYSSVRRALAPPRSPDLGASHAVRQYFGGIADPRMWVIFEPDLLPGYAWVFPLPGGGANVGYGVPRSDGRSGKQRRALWTDLVARPSLRAALGAGAQPSAPVRAWPIPSAFSAQACTHGRVLFAGDAAATADPLTGEGIAQALESGTLAAHAVARGGGSEAVGTRYRNAMARGLARDLHFSARLVGTLRTAKRARAGLRAVDFNDWTRRNFARWMFEDYPRALLLTPRRWHRGMFHGPPAFRE